MDNALYVGLSRQVTLQRSLDVAANNLANVDTAGFKVESLMVQTDAETPRSLPNTQPIKYVLDNGLARNFGQGGLEATSNPLDVGIEGEGFFTVQTANGPRYTRDGRFTIDAQNQLTDHSGNPVQGDGGSTITVDPQKAALSIAKDGTISQGATKIGKLAASRFANLGGLKKQGDNLYDAQGQTPTAATDVSLHQGMVEKSNVQPILQITNLIAITRAYERISQMMSQTEDLSTSAVQRLGKAA